MRRASIALIMTLAVAASAGAQGLSQDAGTGLSASPGSLQGRAAWADPNAPRGSISLRLGDQGFNPARVGLAEEGLRVAPWLLRELPAPPQVGPTRESTPSSAYLGYRLDNLTLSSSIRQEGAALAFGGARVDLGASYGFSLTPRQLITLSGGFTLGQSATTLYANGTGGDALTRWGYRYGEPGAGLRLSWQYAFGRNHYLSTTLGYDRAAGDPGETLQGLGGAASFGTLFGYRW